MIVNVASDRLHKYVMRPKSPLAISGGYIDRCINLTCAALVIVDRLRTAALTRIRVDSSINHHLRQHDNKM